MNALKNNLLTALLLQFIFTAYAAHDSEIWVDYSHNTQLSLSADGLFKFTNSASVTQGSYSLQSNQMMMQDSAGNYYQYHVLEYTADQLILRDSNGVSYTYVHSHNQESNTGSYPWQNNRYDQLLSQKQGLQWSEHENQIYIEFLQFMIGQSLDASEVDAIRQDFINHFNQRPEAFVAEVQGIESTMSQVYSLDNMQAVAMIREEMSWSFNQLVQKQHEMNQYAFVQILNKYVRLLSIDNQTNLSLSNQDVDGYINYMQFQAMLMGQNYQLSQQDRMSMQLWLAQEFVNFPLEQKQTLAFASFIWKNISQQWSNMNGSQQHLYIAQLQSQMNVQNVTVNTQTANGFWDYSNNYDYGYSNQYQDTSMASVRLSESIRETDNQIYTAIQNNMTEQHVLMMNMLNTDSDYEYVVDYGNNY